MSVETENEKKTKLLAALDRGVTQVHLDARRPGVIVPEQFRQEFHLRLNHSYRFDPPDLQVSDWGVRQTLSFQGRRFTVGVPWSAVYAIASMVSEELWMFPSDMPEELVKAATEKVKLPPTEPPEVEAAKGPRAVLREVSLPEAAGEGPKEPTPPRRGHLRVVK